MPLPRRRVKPLAIIYDDRLQDLVDSVLVELAKSVTPDRVALVTLHEFTHIFDVSGFVDFVLFYLHYDEASRTDDLPSVALKDGPPVDGRVIDYTITCGPADTNPAFFATLISDIMQRSHEMPKSLVLHFDTSEFSDEEIAEVLSHFSDLYRELGGDALIIKRTESLDPANILTPEEA